MVTISYVYPNVSKRRKRQEPLRGGLVDRWNSAIELSCEYIEVPADFAKSKEELTGLKAGSFLTRKAIEILYKRDDPVPAESKYILHTDPELEPHHKLEWNNEIWRRKFAEMLTNLSDHFGKSPAKIEIHPGSGVKNPFTSIVEGVTLILDAFEEIDAQDYFVLLENRTDKQISNGKGIRDFWRFISDNHQDLKNKLGIVLDVQQLYTQNKDYLKSKLRVAPSELLTESFTNDLDVIPNEAIKGLHVHRLHRAPKPSDAIPWQSVFNKIDSLEGHLIINPEVHHKNQVKDTIEFCESMLHNMLY